MERMPGWAELGTERGPSAATPTTACICRQLWPRAAAVAELVPKKWLNLGVDVGSCCRCKGGQ